MGYHPFLDKQLAVKILRAEVLHSQQAIERFQREAKILADMKHANILRVYDAGKHGQDYYIASEFIAGQDLADAIPKNGMTAVKAASLIVQMLEALAYAHSQAVVHRDIKPRNARLDKNGDLHVMDFGLASWSMAETAEADATCTKEKLGLTMEGQRMGTPAYMSPEQAKGETASVGPASDIYSVGVVLYELLTGRYPFDARDPFAMWSAHVYHKPEPPSTRRADVPPELDAVCLKAMEKRPAERFPSAEAFSQTLRDWLDGQPLEIRSAKTKQRLKKPQALADPLNKGERQINSPAEKGAVPPSSKKWAVQKSLAAGAFIDQFAQSPYHRPFPSSALCCCFRARCS